MPNIFLQLILLVLQIGETFEIVGFGALRLLLLTPQARETLHTFPLLLTMIPLLVPLLLPSLLLQPLLAERFHYSTFKTVNATRTRSVNVQFGTKVRHERFCLRLELGMLNNLSVSLLMPLRHFVPKF